MPFTLEPGGKSANVSYLIVIRLYHKRLTCGDIVIDELDPFLININRLIPNRLPFLIFGFHHCWQFFSTLVTIYILWHIGEQICDRQIVHGAFSIRWFSREAQAASMVICSIEEEKVGFISGWIM